MNVDQYLAYLRRRLRDVDDTAPLYDDTVLLEYSQDALITLTVRQTIGFDTYTITLPIVPDLPASPTPGDITPDLTSPDGVLLATKTAYMLLSDLYTEKVRSGELGISWQSGLERESTIDLRKAFSDGVKALAVEINDLLLLRASRTSGTRPQ